MKDYFVSILTKYDDLRGKEILPPLCNTLERLTNKGSKVLDVACGTGLFLIPIATEFDLRLFGSDLSSGMLETAHKKARNDPKKVLCRTRNPIYIPSAPYELYGNDQYPVDVPAVVFPVGAIVIKNKLIIYAGAADKYTILLSCNLDNLVDYLCEYGSCSS